MSNSKAGRRRDRRIAASESNAKWKPEAGGDCSGSASKKKMMESSVESQQDDHAAADVPRTLYCPFIRPSGTTSKQSGPPPTNDSAFFRCVDTKRIRRHVRFAHDPSVTVSNDMSKGSRVVDRDSAGGSNCRPSKSAESRSSFYVPRPPSPPRPTRCTRFFNPLYTSPQQDGRGWYQFPVFPVMIGYEKMSGQVRTTD
jgi:hypothetical protein